MANVNANEPNVLHPHKIGGMWPVRLLYFAGLLVAMSVSTQHFAKLYGYVPQLGVSVDHWYAPWDIALWWLKYSKYYPRALMQSVMFGGLVLIPVTLGVFIWAQKVWTRPTATDNLHDSGRWASFDDIRTAGLLPSFDLAWYEELLRDLPETVRLSIFAACAFGLMFIALFRLRSLGFHTPTAAIFTAMVIALVFFGLFEYTERRLKNWKEPDGVWVGGILQKRWGFVWLGESLLKPLRKRVKWIPRGLPLLMKREEVRVLKHSGPEHIAAFAPTRSGKGVGLIIGTLLSWKESMICTDIKGELWELTSNWRRNEGGNLCLRFAPASPSKTLPDGTRATARWNPLDEVRIRPHFERDVVGHARCERGGRWVDDEGDLPVQRDADGFIEWNDEKGVGDAQNLAMLIVDPLGKGLEDHWAKTAHAITVGLILHVIYMWQAGLADYPPSLRRIDQIISDPNLRLKDLWAEMILGGSNPTKGTRGYYRNDAGVIDPREKEDAEAARKQAQKQGKVAPPKPMTAHKGSGHPAAVSAAQDMVDRPENEGGSVISTAKSNLALYRDPIVGENTSYSDFSIMDLMHYEKPVSLYVILPPSDKDKMMPLVRILLNATMRNLVDGKPKLRPTDPNPYKHRLLCMFDEFPSVGKLPIVQEGLAYVAGYGIKCYLIAQDREQILDDARGYGRNESITSNCHIQVAYAPLKTETAKYLSEKCGEYTVVEAKRTTSGGGSKSGGRSTSDSLNETKRSLLTPFEVMTLPAPVKDSKGMIVRPGRMLITAAGMPAIYGTQSLFFMYPEILRRNSLPGLTFSDVVIPNVVSPTERKYTEKELAQWDRPVNDQDGGSTTSVVSSGAPRSAVTPETVSETLREGRAQRDRMRSAEDDEGPDRARRAGGASVAPEWTEGDHEREHDSRLDEFPGPTGGTDRVSESTPLRGPVRGRGGAAGRLSALPMAPRRRPSDGKPAGDESASGESDAGSGDPGGIPDRVVVLETAGTGGLPEDGHRLIEIGCVEIIKRQLTKRRFHEHVNPERPMEPEIAEELDITDAELADCPTFDEIADELMEFLSGASLVAYNAAFDLALIDAEMKRAGLPSLKGDGRRKIVDTLLLAQRRHPGKRTTVEALCQRYGVKLDSEDGAKPRKDALSNAERLARLYLAMTKKDGGGGAARVVSGGGGTDRAVDESEAQEAGLWDDLDNAAGARRRGADGDEGAEDESMAEARRDALRRSEEGSEADEQRGGAST